MTEFTAIASVVLLLDALASLLAYVAAGRLLPRAEWLRRIGKTLHAQKMASLKKPPLSYYQRAVDRRDFGGAFAIVLAGILLKSLVAGLFGLIVVFVLPISIFTMPALAAAHGDAPAMRRWVSTVTAVQATSHLLAAAAGFAIVWLWIRQDVTLVQTFTASAPALSLFVALSVVTGIVAAWIETDGHMNRGFLDPR